MSKDVAIVFWYERDNGHLRSESFPLGWPHAGLTYEDEVRIKYARDPVRMITMYPKTGGGYEAFQYLKAEAEAYRKSLPEDHDPSGR